MNRRTLFVASWKANKRKKDVIEWMEEVQGPAAAFLHEVALCPSYPHLDLVLERLPSTIKMGAQDCSRHGMGPYTGEITASMLTDYKVEYCIVGHVERRMMGETDEIINQKIKQCLANGITPVICLGETLAEYDNNQTRVVIERQMRDGLVGIKDYDKLVLCYMPIWSIGTGFYTSGEYANLISDFMRKTMQSISGVPMVGNIPVLYGGGVTQSNAKEYLEQPDIDGLVFAVSALKVKDFSEMINTKFTQKSFAGE